MKIPAYLESETFALDMAIVLLLLALASDIPVSIDKGHQFMAFMDVVIALFVGFHWPAKWRPAVKLHWDED